MESDLFFPIAVASEEKAFFSLFGGGRRGHGVLTSTAGTTLRLISAVCPQTSSSSRGPLLLPQTPPPLPQAPSSPSRPRSSLPCRLPLPGSLLGALGLGGGGWAGRPGTPGSLPLPFAGLPWLRPREAGQGWQKRSVSWAHDATLSLWRFSPSCHLRGAGGGGAVDWLSPLAGLWFPEASLCTSSGLAVRAVSTSSKG